MRAARGAGLSVVLVHECDPARGGCEFGHFFQTTPQDLISDGLYARVAVACQVGQHRTVSLCLLAREVGAVRYHKKGALWSRGGRRSTKPMAAQLRPRPNPTRLGPAYPVGLEAPSSKLSPSRDRGSGTSNVDEGPRSNCQPSCTNSTGTLAVSSCCSVGKLARADDSGNPNPQLVKRLEITPELVEQTKVVELIRTPRGLGLRCEDDGLGHCRVVAIRPDSQAGRSGALAVHDRLVALNGHPLTSYASFKETLVAIAIGAKVAIEIAPAALAEIEDAKSAGSTAGGAAGGPKDSLVAVTALPPAPPSSATGLPSPSRLPPLPRAERAPSTPERGVGGASQRGGAGLGPHTPTGVQPEHGGGGSIGGSRAPRAAAISPGLSQAEMERPRARRRQRLLGEITQIDIDKAAEVDMSHNRHRACPTPPMSTSAVSSGGLVGLPTSEPPLQVAMEVMLYAPIATVYIEFWSVCLHIPNECS